MKKFAKIISSEKKWFQVSTDTSFTYPLIPVSFKWFEERKRRQKEYKRAKQRDRELIMGMDQASMPLYINSALPNTQTKKNNG